MLPKWIWYGFAVGMIVGIVCAQPKQTFPAEVQAHIDRAQVYLDQQKYTELVKELRAAITLWPNTPGAYYQLGFGLFQLGNLAEAEKAFEKELGFGSPDPYSLYYLGRIRLQGELRRRAVESFEKSLAAGEVLDVRQRLGANYLALNRVDDAVQLLEDSVKIHPEDGGLHYLLARAYKLKGRTAEAKHEFEATARLKTKINTDTQSLTALAQALTSKDEVSAAKLTRDLAATSDADVLIGTGTLLGQAGRHEEALPFLRKAIVVSPKLPEAHYNLARAHIALGQQENAFAELRLATELKPEFYEAHVLLGALLAGAGQSEDAIKHLRAALTVRDDSPRLMMMLGLQYYGQRYYSDAVEVLTKAVKLQPNDPEPRFLLIQAHYRNLDYERALSLAQETRERFPNDALAHYHVAAQLNNFSRLPEARAELDAALAKDPKLVEARVMLGDVLFKIGKPAESSMELRRALADDGALMDAHAGIGKALIQMKSFAEAASAMEEAVRIDAAVPALHLYLSQAYRALGRAADSKREADTFSRLNQERAKARDLDVERKYPGPRGGRNE